MSLKSFRVELSGRLYGVHSLMYLATCTRPDLAAAVSELSKFSQNPGIAHWEGVKRVLRYVSGTVGDGLLYKRGAQVEVWGYSDARCRNRLSICLSSYSGIINPVETIVRMHVSRYFISIGLCA